MSSPPSNGQFTGLTRKMIGVGLLAGAAIGAVATARARGLTMPSSAPESMIDWDRVRAIAVNMNRADALTMAQRSRLDDDYRKLVAQCLPLVSASMGVTIESPVDRTFAYDRVDWIHANIFAFRNLLAPIDDLLSQPSGKRSVAAALMGTVNRQIVSAEMGMLLGYLGRRVLGQYDLALLGGEDAGPGQLYFVEPNIVATEHLLKLPGDEFRLWLALHETTHVFQFEGFSWVRPYFQSLLDEYFVFLKSDLHELSHGGRALKLVVNRLREGQRGNQSWLESLMTPEQKSVFDRIQALMCMIEGYSNFVMNDVGKELLKNYERIAHRFEQRQRNRGWGEQVLARITGLDVKLEQYRLGEAFVNQIVAAHGPEAGKLLWHGPETLPTLTEIREPELWSSRVMAGRRPT
jgi:coenzyme F420 biosynthesis associated uncharacterized protein